MCRFIETIQVRDGKLQNLAHHNRRMNETRQAVFGMVDQLDILDYTGDCPESGFYKCRVVFLLSAAAGPGSALLRFLLSAVGAEVSGISFLSAGTETSTIVITHYQRLLDYIKPDIVHVLYKGRIVKTAGPELALELEEKGYDWIKKEVGE